MADSQIPIPVADDVKSPVTHLFARRYLELLSNVGSALVGGGVPILLGFSPLPDSFPLVAFAQSSPRVALGIAGGLLLLHVIAVTLSLRAWGAASGGAAYSQPYRAVVGVHSLQLTPGSGLVIEQVSVVLDAVALAPSPLNVWSPGAPNDYSSNPYLAVYHGELAGAHLVAFSQHQPPTHTELGEGQSDELDIQIMSTTPVDIRFHVEVIYSVKGGTPLAVLALKKREFEVDFGDASNWRGYRLDGDGQFTPDGS